MGPTRERFMKLRSVHSEILFIKQNFISQNQGKILLNILLKQLFFEPQWFQLRRNLWDKTQCDIK